MKNNKLIIVSVFLSFIFLDSFSQDIKFKAEKLDVQNNGNTLTAFKAETIIPDKNIEINSEKANYKKKEEILIFTKNIKFKDKINNLLMQSEKIEYKKLEDIIYSEGDTSIDIRNKYNIKSENIYIDRNKQIIYGNDKTTIVDDENNTIQLLDKFRFNFNDEIIKSKNAFILDKNGNKYLFEDLIVNLKSNEIIGKELKINFKKTYFGNEKNDPLLKGRSSYSNEKELKVYKAVFSTCNIENKKCRGWEVIADEFRHDKVNKIFEYKNSWLKILDHKIFYLPYLSHPDPSVKRKSGFLTPSYTSSESLGTSINFPYFKTLGEDKDITFNPRYYADKSFLLQNEYRQALQNSKILSDFSFLIGESGTKGHIFYNQVGKINENNYEINLQNVKGDNYLKNHKLSETSSLIENDSLLISNLNLDWKLQNSSLNTSFMIFEDLSKNYHDRYQYIFPDFNFYKNIDIPKDYNGNFNFNSYGYNKLFDTNVTETVLTNDFLFTSNEIISSKGTATDFDLLIKNSNNYSKNSTNYEENLNYNLYGIFKVDTSYPLRKKNKNFVNLLKPTASFRYSPNGNNDMSSKDLLLNYNSVFDLNRISSNSQVEGGESLSLGIEFKRNDIFGSSLLDLKLAQVFKLDENNNLPTKSKLNNKRSDLFGNISYKFNENSSLKYFFSYDKDLKYSNLDQFSYDLNVNNFYTNISYYSEHNDLPVEEHIKSTSKLKLNDENILSFEISKDLDENFTQYYDLIYSYETDCISFNFNYNKSFYQDGNLEPNKSLSFLIKIIPFTELGVQNIESIVGN